VADDLARLLRHQRDFRIEVFVQAADQIGLGGGGKGGEMDRPDRLGVVGGRRPDDQGHVVAMSGASSAFIPTTL
jgi:hypothetical protein